MIIAEIGLNHLGCEEYLQTYLQKLLCSPVDAITIQIREKKFYKNTRFDNLELSMETYNKISDIVRSGGKKFGLATSDLKCLPSITKQIDFFKILSKDIGDKEIINQLVNSIDSPVFISTGMASNQSIESLINMINIDKKKNVNLIHTRLSNKVEDTNLKAIPSMKKLFGLPVAFGNHCENTNITYTAVAYEPSAIFFYVKGFKSVDHPDDKHAILLKDVEEYCKNIKQMMTSLGSGKKEKTNNTIKGQK